MGIINNKPVHSIRHSPASMMGPQGHGDFLSPSCKRARFPPPLLPRTGSCRLPPLLSSASSSTLPFTYLQRSLLLRRAKPAERGGRRRRQQPARERVPLSRLPLRAFPLRPALASRPKIVARRRRTRNEAADRRRLRARCSVGGLGPVGGWGRLADWGRSRSMPARHALRNRQRARRES